LGDSFSGFLHEPPGSDEHPSSNASQIGSILGVLGFLGDSDREKGGFLPIDGVLDVKNW